MLYKEKIKTFAYMLICKHLKKFNGRAKTQICLSVK